MDRLVTFRDRMVDHAGVDALRVKPVGREALLDAYEKAAGRLGTAWGHLFPSKRLKDLGFE